MSLSNSRELVPMQQGRTGYKVVWVEGLQYRGIFSEYIYQPIGQRAGARNHTMFWDDDSRNYFYALDSLEGALMYIEVTRAVETRRGNLGKFAILRVSLDDVSEEGGDNSYTWNYAGEYDNEQSVLGIIDGYSPAPTPLVFRGRWMTILEEVVLLG